MIIRTNLAAFGLLAVASGAQAQTANYEAAKKEGKVVWYTTLIVNQAAQPGPHAGRRDGRH